MTNQTYSEYLIQNIQGVEIPDISSLDDRQKFSVQICLSDILKNPESLAKISQNITQNQSQLQTLIDSIYSNQIMISYQLQQEL